MVESSERDGTHDEATSNQVVVRYDIHLNLL